MPQTNKQRQKKYRAKRETKIDQLLAITKKILRRIQNET